MPDSGNNQVEREKVVAILVSTGLQSVDISQKIIKAFLKVIFMEALEITMMIIMIFASLIVTHKTACLAVA